MSERGATMVSDEDIIEALQSLLRDSNPNFQFNSIGAVVHHLQSKLGFDLTHKVDFTLNQIQLLYRSHPPPHIQQQQHPPKPHFVLNQIPVPQVTSSQLTPDFRPSPTNCWDQLPVEPAVASEKSRGLHELCCFLYIYYCTCGISKGRGILSFCCILFVD